MQAGGGGWLDVVLYQLCIQRHAYFIRGGWMKGGSPPLLPLPSLFSAGPHPEVTSLVDLGHEGGLGTYPGISRGIPWR